MITEKINDDGRTKLRMSLSKLTSSFAKRGIAFVIDTYSEHVGMIQILITGKRGTVQKTLVVVYNTATNEWEVYSDQWVNKLLVLGEISTPIKTVIARLNTLVTKI